MKGRAARLGAIACGCFRVALGLAMAGAAAGCVSPAQIVGVNEIAPRAALDQPDALIIDLRADEEYLRGHLPGAVSLAQEELVGFLSRHGPPHHRPIIINCARGFRSLAGAASVAALGYTHVYSLRGGFERWQELGLPVEVGLGEELGGDRLGPPLIPTSKFEQALIVFQAFAIKPLYMLLTLLLVLFLRRSRDRDLVLVKLGLLFFLIGELLCATNYVTTESTSVWLEIGHSLGMVATGVAIPWGLFLLIDRRILRYSDPKVPCAAIRLCKQCWKRDEVRCGLHRLFLYLTPMLAIAALIPLTAPLRPLSVTVSVFGDAVPWEMGLVEQLVVFRGYPIVASAALLVASLLLARGEARANRAHLPFFIGFGFMSFSVARFALFNTYRSVPFFADTWEEVTELMTIVLLGTLLLVFRSQLGLRWRSASAEVE